MPNSVNVWVNQQMNHAISAILNQEAHKPMTGIQFITDDKGRKTAAVIDLKKHGDLWEDFQDLLVSRSRSTEKRTPLSKVKERLVASGKLRA